MNNCCNNVEFIEGVIINNPVIYNPEIIGGVLKSVALEGGVTLDDATAIQLANILCPKLASCVLQDIDGAHLKDMVLEDTQLLGTITLDAEAAQDMASAICNYLTDCIINAVQTNVLTSVRLVTPQLQQAALTGGLTLDDDVAQNIATAIAEHLRAFIISVIESDIEDGVTLKDLTVIGLNLSGVTTIDSQAAQGILTALCPLLGDCVINIIQSGSLSGVTLSNPSIIGGLVIDGDIAQDIVSAISPYLGTVIKDAVEHSTYDSVTLTNYALNTGVIAGGVTFDESALDSIRTGIVQKIIENLRVSAPVINGAVQFDDTAEDVIRGIIFNSALVNLVVSNISLDGGITIDQDVTQNLMEALSDLITALINTQISLYVANPQAYKVNGGTITQTAGSDNTWTDSKLAGTTAFTGNVSLDQTSISDFCSYLTPCIEAVISSYLVIYVDNVTIGGAGTMADPLHAIINDNVPAGALPPVTTDVSVPTTIQGGRDLLLGKPDIFIKIGDYVIPAWQS